MSENETLAVTPAPEPEVTAAPEPEVVAQEQQPEEKSAKTFTQEELDALVGKRLARERRKWERETAAKAKDLPNATADLPSKEDNPDAYAEL